MERASTHIILSGYDPRFPSLEMDFLASRSLVGIRRTVRKALCNGLHIDAVE